MTRRLTVLLLAAGVALTPAALVPAGPATAAPAQCQAYHQPANYELWQVKRVTPERAWPVSRGRGVTVAVVDSGVNGTHPALAGRVDHGTDLVDSKGSADQDCVSHGSTVGGIIAGDQLSGSGFAGVAPDARLLPIRIANDMEQFTGGSERVAQAIRYAVDHHAKVINLSLTTENTAVLRTAVAYARDHDVVMVAATGNDGQHTTTYPAAYPGVIGVAGIGESGDPDPQSNTGDEVDLAAPSLRIVGPAGNGDGYVLWGGGGTSFAAPFVAGTAALVRSYRPDLSADEVARRLEATADHPADGRDDTVGYGVVNPYRAVTAVLGSPGGAAPAAGALPGDGRHAAAGGGTTGRYLWAAGAMLAAVLVLLVAVAVVPRAVRRGWRPGLRPALPVGVPTRRRYPVFDPATAPREAPSRAVEPVRITSKDPAGSFTVDVDFH
ncbi:type VII secretion-associated serine protease mycosin [Actinocatenispora rupis]|uniref:Peptidase S8/S53 domain-containing protein n=1 Tax=Actinocatenispora rupis TaxID=519421 RepID=A0A8J3J6Q8_9ACTN|nr:type VII secretion-associated serine protease mycosin [Actinocatenispora rupis]GID15855.1 hypothetical protein Aru02nite_67440 [Actinocatenispora rupis]